MYASLSTSEQCGSGNSDGAGHVGFTFGTPPISAQVGIDDPAGNRLSVTPLARRLASPLLEQLDGFTGAENNRFFSIPFAIAPDGTLSEDADVGGVPVLDPLGGMVVNDVPFSFHSPPPDTYLAAYEPPRPRPRPHGCRRATRRRSTWPLEERLTP